MPRAASKVDDAPAPLFEAVQSFASGWIEQNALDDFPGGGGPERVACTRRPSGAARRAGFCAADSACRAAKSALDRAIRKSPPRQCHQG